MTKVNKTTEVRKITETLEIDNLVESYAPVDVTELIDTLQDYIKDYGDKVSIYCEPAGYDGCDEWHLSFERNETSNEQLERLDEARQVREEKSKKRKEKLEKDRLQYEKLKKRFGD